MRQLTGEKAKAINTMPREFDHYHFFERNFILHAKRMNKLLDAGINWPYERNLEKKLFKAEYKSLENKRSDYYSHQKKAKQQQKQLVYNSFIRNGRDKLNRMFNKLLNRPEPINDEPKREHKEANSECERQDGQKTIYKGPSDKVTYLI